MTDPADPDRAWNERGERREALLAMDLDENDGFEEDVDDEPFNGFLDDDERREHDLALEDAESMRRDRERGETTPWRM